MSAQVLRRHAAPTLRPVMLALLGLGWGFGHGLGLAEAHPEPVTAANPAPRPNELRIDVGLASPIGEVGVTASRWFLDTVAVEAGMGYGYFGLAPSLMVKLGGGRGHHRFTIGGGSSASLAFDPKPGVTPVLWLNGEIGYEYLADDSWLLALSGGVTAGMAGTLQPFCLIIDDAGCRVRDARGIVAPEFRLGLGRRF